MTRGELAGGSAPSNTATVTVTGSGKPAITRMSSKKNKPGTSATIFGSGFSATKTNNTVYFGTKKATIKTARAGSLKVTIPAGLRKGNIGVCVVVKGVKSNTVQFTIK